MTIHDIDQYIEFQKLRDKHLDLFGDDIEVILKGHLLIESMLSRILEKSVQNIKKIADEYTISPTTIFYEINKYAYYHNKKKIDFGSDSLIHKVTSKFNRETPTISEYLFKDKAPSSHEFINRSKEAFETPFFDTLKKYIKAKKIKPAFIQRLLDLNYPDAKSLYQELS